MNTNTHSSADLAKRLSPAPATESPLQAPASPELAGLLDELARAEAVERKRALDLAPATRAPRGAD